MARASRKTERAGHLERHFRRVDRVVLAVEAGDADVHDRPTEMTPVGHCLLGPFLHSGDVLARDHAADDIVDELEARPPLHRLDP